MVSYNIRLSRLIPRVLASVRIQIDDLALASNELNDWHVSRICDARTRTALEIRTERVLQFLADVSCFAHGSWERFLSRSEPILSES